MSTNIVTGNNITPDPREEERELRLNNGSMINTPPPGKDPTTASQVEESRLEPQPNSPEQLLNPDAPDMQSIVAPEVTSLGLPEHLLNNPNIAQLFPDIPNWRQKMIESVEVPGERQPRTILDFPHGTFRTPTPPLVDQSTGQGISDAYAQEQSRQRSIVLRDRLQSLIDYRPYNFTEPSNELNADTSVPGSNRSVLRNNPRQGDGEPAASNPISDWFRRSGRQIQIVGSALEDIWNVIVGRPEDLTPEQNAARREIFEEFVTSVPLVGINNQPVGEDQNPEIGNVFDVARLVPDLLPNATEQVLEGLVNAAPVEEPDGTYRNNPMRGEFGEYGRGWFGAFNAGLAATQQAIMAGIYGTVDIVRAVAGESGNNVPVLGRIPNDEERRGFAYRFGQAFGGVDLGFTNVRDGSGNRYLSVLPPDATEEELIKWGTTALLLDVLVGGGADDLFGAGFDVARLASRGQGTVAQRLRQALNTRRMRSIARSRQTLPTFGDADAPTVGTLPEVSAEAGFVPNLGEPRGSIQNMERLQADLPALTPENAPTVGTLPDISPEAGFVLSLDEFQNPLLSPDAVLRNVTPQEAIEELMISPPTAIQLPMVMPRSNEELLNLGIQLGVIDPGVDVLNNGNLERLYQVFGNTFSRWGVPVPEGVGEANRLLREAIQQSRRRQPSVPGRSVAARVTTPDEPLQGVTYDETLLQHPRAQEPVVETPTQLIEPEGAVVPEPAPEPPRVEEPIPEPEPPSETPTVLLEPETPPDSPEIFSESAVERVPLPVEEYVEAVAQADIAVSQSIREAGEVTPEAVEMVLETVNMPVPSEAEMARYWLEHDAPRILRSDDVTFIVDYLSTIDDFTAASRGLAELEYNIDTARRLVINEAIRLNTDLRPFVRGNIGDEIAQQGFDGNVVPGVQVEELPDDVLPPQTQFADETVDIASEEVGDDVAGLPVERQVEEFDEVVDDESARSWGERMRRQMEEEDARVAAMAEPEVSSEDEAYERYQAIASGELIPQSEIDSPNATRLNQLITESKNYFTFPELRQLLSDNGITERAAQDELIFSLRRSNSVEFSTLQEAHRYTSEQISAGIKQPVGGPLFFTIVLEPDEVVRQIDSAGTGNAVIDTPPIADDVAGLPVERQENEVTDDIPPIEEGEEEPWWAPSKVRSTVDSPNTERLNQLIEASDNYFDFPSYRKLLSDNGITSRAEQDSFIYRMQRENLVEYSTLQEGHRRTTEQINQGIAQSVGGPLFYVIVNEPDELVRRLDSAGSSAIDTPPPAAIPEGLTGTVDEETPWWKKNEIQSSVDSPEARELNELITSTNNYVEIPDIRDRVLRGMSPEDQDAFLWRMSREDVIEISTLTGYERNTYNPEKLKRGLPAMAPNAVNYIAIINDPDTLVREAMGIERPLPAIVEEQLVAPVIQEGVPVAPVLAQQPVPPIDLSMLNWYHGSRQTTFNGVNFANGTAHEYGVGLYVSADPDYADVASRAARTTNNPVPGSTRLSPQGSGGTVYRVQGPLSASLELNRNVTPSLMEVFYNAAEAASGPQMARRYIESVTGDTKLNEMWLRFREVYGETRGTSIPELQYREFSRRVAESIRNMGYDSLMDARRRVGVMLPGPDGTIPAAFTPERTGRGTGNRMESLYARHAVDALLNKELPNRVTEAWELQSRTALGSSMIEEMVKSYVPASAQTNEIVNHLADAERALRNDVIATGEMDLAALVEDAPRAAEETPDFQQFRNTDVDDPCL